MLIVGLHSTWFSKCKQCVYIYFWSELTSRTPREQARRPRRVGEGYCSGCVELEKKIVQCDWEFPDEENQPTAADPASQTGVDRTTSGALVSQSARDFLRAALQKDAGSRMSALQMLQRPWLFDDTCDDDRNYPDVVTDHITRRGRLLPQSVSTRLLMQVRAREKEAMVAKREAAQLKEELKLEKDCVRAKEHEIASLRQQLDILPGSSNTHPSTSKYNM